MALTVISANIEGLTAVKSFILSEMCKRECCHCLCFQETHRSTNLPRPKIAGMSLVVERPHNKYGSAILIRNDLKVKKTNERGTNGYSLHAVGVPQSGGGDCANCIHLSRLSGGPATQFFGGSQSWGPTAWLAERLLLAGDIESNPGPKPTLKTLSHTRTQPPHLPRTLAHQSNPFKPPHSHSHLKHPHLYTTTMTSSY